MKTLIPIAAAVALLAIPVTAQKMGHSNANAPTVGQSLNLAEKGTVELSYTSITWANGTWAKQLADEATRDAMRTRINDGAKAAPLGTLTTSVDLVINHVPVSAGTHQLAFTLNERFQWQIVLIRDGKQAALRRGSETVPRRSRRNSSLCKHTDFHGDPSGLALWTTCFYITSRETPPNRPHLGVCRVWGT